MTTKSVPSTLLGVFEPILSQKTAVILPEVNLHISYGSLRDQVRAVAEQLAVAGITPGDRVGMALPNGRSGRRTRRPAWRSNAGDAAVHSCVKLLDEKRQAARERSAGPHPSTSARDARLVGQI